MKIFDKKQGFIQHPAMMMFITFLLGLVAAYVWINYLSFPNPFCK